VIKVCVPFKKTAIQVTQSAPMGMADIKLKYYGNDFLKQ